MSVDTLDIFVSGHGQRDNLGDSGLRRGLLRTLRRAGRLHVLVDDSHRSYESGLQLEPDDVVYRSRKRWGAELRSLTTTGRTAYGANAGELVASPGTVARLETEDRRFIRDGLRRGGLFLHLGYGLRNPASPWARVLGQRLSMGSLVTWRDDASCTAAGVGTVVPDWAFGEGQSSEQLRARAASPRDIVALSLRCDRPAPSDRWIENVRAFAHAQGAEVVAVPQVARDREAAFDVARRLEGRVLDWPGVSHAEYEELVRGLYTRSIAVLGDRLHALVFGATEGAVPVVFGTAPDAKIGRTLTAAGLTGFAVDDPEAGDAPERLQRLVDRRHELPDHLDVARSAIADLGERVVRAAERRAG
ncbi:hypothetical protein [Agromyces atrinae]|uniref:Polysaccharide pyruvyl transferase WcaK-like protein n=1 Tax=Agromyces atrinae TaxID=592376 RepID=A0A4Q2M7J5_9MICO|nr:hypothetical protein [Agromyces atrinae]NYD68526.1 polysaccharide pyruvyl transferase WcaK-like protein [Agromyces atrinae]RXZ85911.1 hypothetical protein ESP50_11880 [Agromyces atrinae]